MRGPLIACSFFLALCAAAPASADFYECRGANGRVMFQDRPCPDGTQGTQRVEPDRLTQPTPAPDDGSRTGAPERPLVTRIKAPVRVPADQRYVIDRSLVQGKEWQDMLAAARGAHLHGTLVRVFLEHATESDLIQAVAGKLANPKLSSGGGRQREFPSGTFLLVEHLGSASETGREPLELGNPLHGVSKIWLPVAPAGTIAGGGDVVLGRMASAQLGQLEVRLPPGYRMGPLAIGPLVVGGRYGEEFECASNGACRVTDLAPGPYKLQFPKIDAKRSRFDANIEPGKRLILDFRPGSAKTIMIVERRHTTLVPASRD